VTIFARLLGQLGVAVTSRAPGERLRPLMQRALALAILLGLVGAALIVAGGVVVQAIGLRLALLAAPALIPNIVSACVSGALLGQARIRVWNYVQALPPLPDAPGDAHHCRVAGRRGRRGDRRLDTRVLPHRALRARRRA
jgi:hypothetical protein